MRSIIEWFKNLFNPKDATSPEGPKTRVISEAPAKVETKPSERDLEVIKWLAWCGFDHGSVVKGADKIPFSVGSDVPMKTRGRYKGGWPKGLVVHYTAGRDKKGRALKTIEGGAKEGLTYLCIDRDGTLVQAHAVSEWGYHAGKSAWKGFHGGLNDDLIGVEMNNPGKLKEKDGKLYAWYGEEVPREECRYVTYESYGCPTGWYKKYSPEQEKTLTRLILWLYYSSPVEGHFSMDNVLGHHEIAGLKGLGFWRKSDPGGSLWLPMEEFRNFLKSLTK